jgi:type II secretory pathway pseudopilin PulG
MKKQKGFTMSLLVALIIWASIALLVVRANTKQVINKNNENIELTQQFELLNEALAMYYIQSCNTGNINQADILSPHFPQELFYENGAPFNLNINDAGPIPFSTISLTLVNDGYTNNYARTVILKGGSLVNRTLTLKNTLLGPEFKENPCNP